MKNKPTRKKRKISSAKRGKPIPPPKRYVRQPTDSKSTERRYKRFALEYMKDFNITQATIRAGYTSNPDSAHTTGYEILKTPWVQQFIEEKLKQYTSDLELTAQNLVRALAIRALSNMNDYARVEKGKLRILDSLKRADGKTIKPYELGCAIQELSQEKGKLKIKLHNPDSAADKLMKYLGLYKEQTPLEVLLNLFPEPLRSQVRQALADGSEPQQQLPPPKEVNGEVH